MYKRDASASTNSNSQNIFKKYKSSHIGNCKQNMKIDNYFKTTKVKKKINHITRNRNTLLYMRNSVDVKNNSNQPKAYSENSILQLSGNYSREPWKQLTDQEREKQIKLDAFIERISQKSNICSAENYNTNCSPTNLRQINKLDFTSNVNESCSEYVNNNLLKDAFVVGNKNAQTNKTSVCSVNSNQEIHGHSFNNSKNEYYLFGERKDTLYNSTDSNTSKQDLNSKNFDSSKTQRLLNFINNLIDKRDVHYSSEKTKSIKTGIDNLKQQTSNRLETCSKLNSSFSSSLYSVDTNNSFQKEGSEEFNYKEDEFREENVVFDQNINSSTIHLDQMGERCDSVNPKTLKKDCLNYTFKEDTRSVLTDVEKLKQTSNRPASYSKLPSSYSSNSYSSDTTNLFEKEVSKEFNYKEDQFNQENSVFGQDNNFTMVHLDHSKGCDSINPKSLKKDCLKNNFNENLKQTSNCSDSFSKHPSSYSSSLCNSDTTNSFEKEENIEFNFSKLPSSHSLSSCSLDTTSSFEKEANKEFHYEDQFSQENIVFGQNNNSKIIHLDQISKGCDSINPKSLKKELLKNNFNVSKAYKINSEDTRSVLTGIESTKQTSNRSHSFSKLPSSYSSSLCNSDTTNSFENEENIEFNFSKLPSSYSSSSYSLDTTNSFEKEANKEFNDNDQFSKENIVFGQNNNSTIIHLDQISKECDLVIPKSLKKDHLKNNLNVSMAYKINSEDTQSVLTGIENLKQISNRSHSLSKLPSSYSSSSCSSDTTNLFGKEGNKEFNYKDQFSKENIVFGQDNNRTLVHLDYSKGCDSSVNPKTLKKDHFKNNVKVLGLKETQSLNIPQLCPSKMVLDKIDPIIDCNSENTISILTGIKNLKEQTSNRSQSHSKCSRPYSSSSCSSDSFNSFEKEADEEFDYKADEFSKKNTVFNQNVNSKIVQLHQDKIDTVFDSNLEDTKSVLTFLKNLKQQTSNTPDAMSKLPNSNPSRSHSFDFINSLEKEGSNEFNYKKDEFSQKNTQNVKYLKELAVELNPSVPHSDKHSHLSNYDKEDLNKSKLVTNITTLTATNLQNNLNVLQKIAHKYTAEPSEYREMYQRTGSENNEINPSIYDDQNINPTIIHLDQIYDPFDPKTFKQDHWKNTFEVPKESSSLNIPQVFSSQIILDEIHPVVDCAKNVDVGLKSIVRTSDNILDDKKIFDLLTTEYKKYVKAQEIRSNDLSRVNMSRIEKLTQQIPFKRSNPRQYVKRYKKQNKRIYRLKVKKQPMKAKSTAKQDMNIEDVLKHMTQSYLPSESQLSESDSCSSISTPSSYITDVSLESIDSGDLSDEAQRTIRTQLNKIIKEEKKSFVGKIFDDFKCERYDVLKKIQNIFLQVYHDFSEGRSSYVKYKRHNFENCVFKDRRLQFKSSNDCAFSVIKSNHKNSRTRFKLILYVLKKIQTLLETNTKITKRELYYQLKEVIHNQAVMDRTINVISCILDSGMWALNIIAQKGLVYGELEILLLNGATLNCNVPGTSIPPDISDIVELQSTASFILVVEKEAIFYKLIEEDLPNKLTKSFIMVTGKGFPDLNTQLFLRKLWIVMSLPIFILVDADPHGVQIMLNYRFGSVNNAHVSQHLAIPNAKWLGIYPSEIEEFDMKRQPLTQRELKLVNQLLKTPYMDENPEIASELNVLLKNKYKAGIEGLVKSQIFLSEVYLTTKFVRNKFVS